MAMVLDPPSLEREYPAESPARDLMAARATAMAMALDPASPERVLLAGDLTAAAAMAAENIICYYISRLVASAVLLYCNTNILNKIKKSYCRIILILQLC